MLHELYGIEFLMTRQLCQDTVENLFSFIRQVGHTHDHPSPLDFKHRMRLFIVGRHNSLSSQGLYVYCNNEATPCVTTESIRYVSSPSPSTSIGHKDLDSALCHFCLSHEAPST